MRRERLDIETEVAEREPDTCSACGLPFGKKHGFETTCAACFKLYKNFPILEGDASFVWAQLQLQETIEELDRMRKSRDRYKKQAAAPAKSNPSPLDTIPISDLLQLCHPDKHGNGELATEVTKRLLALRKKK